MNYEEMTMAQLKKECVDRKLGTGRSKQELIDKLNQNDEEVSNMTEDEIDALAKKADPVELIASTPYRTSGGAKIFSVSFTHSGHLLDEDHDRYRMQTRHLAMEAGLEPYGNSLYSARLDRVEDGFLYYEIEVK